MKRFVCISVFVVLVFTLSISIIQDAHAQNIDLDGQLSCEAIIDSTWDDNTGICTVSSLTILPGEILTIFSGITLTNNGDLNNDGTINNNGDLNNDGTINNNGDLNNDGTINNSGDLNNDGTINNNSAINNSGDLNNDGTINNSGDLNNDGTISQCGTVTGGDPSPNPYDTTTCDTPTDITLDANKDSFMRSGAKNTNEGDNTILMVQKAGNKRTLVSFDLSDYEGQQISSATLKLYVTYNGGNWGKHNDRMIEVHKLLSDWTEGNGANFIPRNLDVDDEPTKNKGTGPGVTWACSTDSNISNKKTDCHPKWKGGNFDGAISDSEIITSDTLNQWIELDVTGDVNSFLSDNADNFGWLVKKSNEHNSGRIAFASSENTNLDNHPQLVLEFGAIPE